MPPETQLVYEHCIATDRAAASSDDELMVQEQQRTQTVWAALLGH